MRKLISALLCLVMILGMIPAVASVPVSAAESSTYTYVQETPATLAASDNGTRGQWYINGSTFVTDAGSANYLEVAESGYKDIGSLHVYQDNVANNDMSLGVFLGGQAAGTYTVKFYIKGDIGYQDQPFKIYPYGTEPLVSNVSTILGTTEVADWTEVSYDVEVSSDFFYLIFIFSKYNWETNAYIDNIQLINSSGVDVLNGTGNFYTSKTVRADSAVTGQHPVTLDTTKIGDGYGSAPGDEWVPFAPTGVFDANYGFNAWTDSYYCEIVADGYKDAGSLHMVISQNTAVVINAGMVSGEQYTIGMWVKGTASSNRVLGLYGNGDPAIIGNPEYCGEVAASTVPADWTYLERTFTANTNSIVLHGNGWGPADIYIDNVTLKNSSGLDLLSGYGDFYEQKEPTEEAKEYVPAKILDSDPGTLYQWFNFNGYTATEDMYTEIVEEGAYDVGSIHVYQKDGVTAPDNMRIGLNVGSIPVGTYTLKYNIKGNDLGNTSADVNAFYISGHSGLFGQFRNVAGAKTVSDWTELSETVTTSAEKTQIFLYVTKYVNGADYYIDNVRLLDANGNDILNGAGNFCVEKPAESAIKPITIAESNPGTNYEWFNHNGYVNNDTKVLEIVEEGADDVGAVHVYQPDGQTADADMMIGIRVDCVPVGTYTLSYKIKGTDLGNTDSNSNKFYLYGNASLTNQFRVAAGSKTLSDWTTVTETFTTTSDVYYIYLSVSKYVNGANYYVDNVKLLDADGKDYLNGTGNFCIGSAEEDTTKVELDKIYDTDPGYLFKWYNGNSFVSTDDMYIKLVEEGADDIGALHMYQTDAVVAAGDMRVHLRTEGVPAGTYTLQYNIKGTDLGITTTNDTCRFYLNEEPALTTQFRNLAGAKSVSDWTTLTETITTTTESTYFILGISKYVSGIDCYVDNVKLLDAEGNDLLNGAGNFCYEPIEEEEEDVSGTNIYKKSALFTGDSISWGSDRRAWAARIGEKYEMTYVNASVSGASVSTTRIYRMIEQLEENKAGSFDYVIMHGPTNDAWDEVDVGTLSESFDVTDYDVSTYAGALEELFYYARKYFPDAQLGYIINFRFSSSLNNGLRDMSAYVEMAKKICCKWSVPYLDLYNNEELTVALKVGTTVYLPDNVHPNAAGYDILTPYIANWMNDTVATQEAPSLGHSYGSVVTAPTATKEGYTTYTCTTCGHVYVGDTVPALGIGTLRFKSAALVLENNLTIKFYVDGDLFIEDAYTAPYAVFTVGNKTQTVTEYQIIGGDYVFACTNIAPSQMGDTVYASLYATLNGEACSSSMEYGVATYCYNMLGETEDAKLRTLLVDLLNYGAAAQKYAWYNDKTLCNASLTEEQKAWGTSGDPALGSVLNTKYATVENAKATWKAAALVLENAVTVRFRFAAESTEGLSVKIEIGGQTYTINSFEADPYNPGQYYATFNGTVARQMRETMLVTVYEGDTAVSNTLSYSIETYACNKQNVAKLGELVKAMIRYGDSAAAYLN